MLISSRILKQRKKDSGRKEVDMSDVLDGISKKARDHAQTPMQVHKYSNYLKTP
jgi:oligo-1,6-glucosidase